MEIRIHIPRPFLTLGIVVVMLLWWNGVISLRMPWRHSGTSEDASGGIRASAVLAGAAQDIDRERVTLAVLAKREEILRYQLAILEEEALQEKSAEKIKELAETRVILLSIIKERSNSEKLLKLSLEQLWAAEGTAYSTKTIATSVELDWPVYPALGVSAFFEDEAYKKRFGFDHHAVDIPVNQGSAIHAPADGKVLKVSLNGLGYSYIVVEHAGDVQTVFGHVSAATVAEGDSVSYGQMIGRTGGRPGTQGAGLVTTGPHLHFAVKVKGVLVDPIQYLPKLPEGA